MDEALWLGHLQQIEDAAHDCREAIEDGEADTATTELYDIERLVAELRMFVLEADDEAPVKPAKKTTKGSKRKSK